MSKQIFKKGDKVFHWKYGWGKVINPYVEECYTRFEYEDVVTSKLIPVAELSFTEYNFESGGLSHERPFELEVGKSYKAKYGATLIINRIGKYGNYGFQSGQWTENNPCRHAEQWREATDEEVRSALEKETIRRYGENWKDVKIVKSIGLMPDGDNEGIFDSRIFEDNKQGGWVVWNKNGRLFHKGKWAESLEEELRPDFKVGELILVRDFAYGNWVTRFFDSYGEDFIITVGGETLTVFMKYDAKHHNTSKSPEQ